jgi:hypothetical protein
VRRAYTSKCSFQTGLKVRLAIAVVLVCSPSTVRTANGSGRLRSSRLTKPFAPNTVETRHCQTMKDCGCCERPLTFDSQRALNIGGQSGVGGKWSD